MSKQERAMEEFVAKFQVSQQQSQLQSVGIGAPLVSSNNSQGSSNANGSGSSNLISRDGLNNFNYQSIMTNSGVSSTLRVGGQGNETFLVMSLKKQLKELKFECLKKDDELETIKKSLKNTRQQEIEVEIKTYIDECQRLRLLLQDMLHEGPKHPLF